MNILQGNTAKQLREYGRDIKETWRAANKTALLIYFCLIAAYFHAVLRLSPSSNITLFRLLIPLAVFLIARQSRRLLWALAACFGGGVALSALQTLLAQNVFFPGISFSLSHLLVYWIHYFSILLLFGLVACLRSIEKERFFQRFAAFSGIVIKVSIVCNIVYHLAGKDFNRFGLFGNVNNFGCAVCAGMILILCQEKCWWKKLLWFLCAAVVLYLNDSKLSLIGLILAAGFFLVLRCDMLLRKKYSYLMGKRHTDRRKKWTAFALRYWRMAACIACVLLVVCIITSPISINGYNLGEIISSAVSQFVRREYYVNSDSSLHYRVNALIGLGRTMHESACLGVGIGNSGVILGATLPAITGRAQEYFLAPHAWWVEVFSDFGFAVIIPSAILFLFRLCCFVKKEHATGKELFQTVFLLSFPVWSLGASGLYTEYFTLACLFVAAFECVRSVLKWYAARRGKHGCTTGK